MDAATLLSRIRFLSRALYPRSIVVSRLRARSLLAPRAALGGGSVPSRHWLKRTRVNAYLQRVDVDRLPVLENAEHALRRGASVVLVRLEAVGAAEEVARGLSR